jgi:hypothetical protein
LSRLAVAFFAAAFVAVLLLALWDQGGGWERLLWAGALVSLLAFFGAAVRDVQGRQEDGEEESSR